MVYYKLFGVMLLTLMLSVIVQGESLFTDIFFLVSYLMMASVIVLGMRSQKSYENAYGLGFLTLSLGGALSTWVVMDMVRNLPPEHTIFRFAIALVMDVCAIELFREGIKIRDDTRMATQFPTRNKGIFWKD